MADSTSISIQESFLSVFAIPGPPKRRNPNKEEFTIEVSVSIVAVSDHTDPNMHPVERRDLSLMTHWNSSKTFQHTRQSFLSATEAERREFMSNMIQSMEIPFPLENIHWGTLNFTGSQTPSREENLDEIISRISVFIRGCFENNDQKRDIDIHITKLETLPQPEDYQAAPLDDWILENQDNVNLYKHSCLRVLQRLALESPPENKYFGLKSVKVKEETGDDEGSSGSACCLICLKQLEKGLQAVRMPCSHIFHGFCLFRWIDANPSCPLCRFKLCSFQRWSMD